MSDLAQESFKWEREQYSAALAAANERIRGLEAALAETHDAWTARTEDWAAEREISSKLENALEKIAGYSVYGNGKAQYEMQKDANSTLAEVAAIRAKQSKEEA